VGICIFVCRPITIVCTLSSGNVATDVDTDCDWIFRFIPRFTTIQGNLEYLKMILKLVATTLSLLALSACTFVYEEEGLRPRTTEENNAITDSWYPIQSKECQLFVDAFGLITAAIGNNDSQYLLDNMDQIKRDLETTGLVVSQSLLELSQNTLEPSIKSYALELIPLYVRLGDLIADDLTDTSMQTEYLIEMSDLTGKVPDACKS
jgi:hypothetical protein